MEINFPLKQHLNKMSGDSTRKTMLQKLTSTIDEFPVGATKFDECVPNDDVKKSKQTINVLKSKLITLDVFDKIDQATCDGDRERINRLCRERMSCYIATSKAVTTGCVNEFLSNCMQMPDNHPVKQSVVEKLRKMHISEGVLDHLNSILAEKKLKRVEMESEYKRDMLLHNDIVKKKAERALPSEDVIDKLKVKVEKINLMRKLIIAFLLSPEMKLDQHWVGVLAKVRYNVDLNDVLSKITNVI